MNNSYPSVDKPFFLVGSPRSGTSLFRLMLSSHPKIAWSSEFAYSVRFVQDDGTFPDLETYKQWLENNFIFRRQQYTVDPSLNYTELLNSFLWQISEEGNKEIIGATVHEFFNRLQLIWPNAHFIHLLRDPRDVSPSCINMGWGGNVWTGLDQWLKAESLWDKFQPSLTPDKYIEVKYEDLVTNSVETLSRVCQFLGTEFDEKMFDYTKTTTYGMPDGKLANQWRKKLSEREIQLIESRLGSYLVDKGYEFSRLPLIQLSAWEKRQLLIQDWIYKKQFFINRYGLGLVVSKSLSEKLNIKPWQKRVYEEMQKVADKYVKN
ncbi:sulfotransferase [Gloeocapsa sp. PCC 73106]|uniref:sulfotransferase family protein n=1 Tax=Gloeocapsa sp. PCC 73106 TaxID=102232 RepID=UPI0002ACDF92|nr:sulfotransferase [Gloeocapsa sp. PCC 73106]ELR99523.1 sulfotransferase family protein [Gloeocapsa sp. PCC 73106]